MPVEQERDSIEISVEIRYIKGCNSYPTREPELRDEVQRLLQAVRDKQRERTEPVFRSIESKLETILVNLQKLRQMSLICEEEKKFMEDLKEGALHVENCVSKGEKWCFCFEKSKPKFKEEELQGFDNCLESFTRALVNTLQAQAIKKPRFETTRDNNSVNINPEKLASKVVSSNRILFAGSGSGSGISDISKKECSNPTESSATSSSRTLSPAASVPVRSGSGSGDSNLHQEQKPVLKRSSGIMKNECSNPSESSAVSSTRTLSPVGSGTGTADSNLHQEQKPILKRSSAISRIESSNPSENNVSAENSTNEKHRSSNLTRKKDVLPDNFTFPGNSSSKPSEYKKEKDTITSDEVNGINEKQHQSSNQTQIRDVHPDNFTLSGILSNKSRDYKKAKDSMPVSPNNTASSTLFVIPKPSEHVAGLNNTREPNNAAVRGSSVTGLAKQFYGDAEVRDHEDGWVDRDGSDLPRDFVPPYLSF